MVLPGNYFYLYPTSLQNLLYQDDTAIACWTKDKQELTIHMTLQLRIVKDEITDTFDKYGCKWPGNCLETCMPIWDKMITTTIKQTTKDFNTVSYFQERAVVSSAIEAAVSTTLEAEGVSVESLYLGQMFIPYRFEEAVTTKVVTQQQAATVLMERNVTLVGASTHVINANAQADSDVIIGTSTAAAFNLTESAKATGLRVVQQSGARGLASLADTLDLDVNETLAYKYAKQLAEVGEKKKLVIGYEDAVMKTTD